LVRRRVELIVRVHGRRQIDEVRGHAGTAQRVVELLRLLPWREAVLFALA
jgi:hypothetical protein